jgi:hypothetical protein
MVVGDVLLFNRSAELPGRPAQLIDVWVGEETHKLAAEKQRKDHRMARKKS